jgi:Uma2 family endonuclease
MASLPATRRFNVREYHRMAAAGILGEDDRVELIEGEIVQMPPMGSRHAACIGRLARPLFAQAGDAAAVRVQLPIRLGERSEPEPDLALVRPRTDDYASAHPGPADVLLVIEVAENTARYDRSVKAPLYARADLPEYWLVDLQRERVDAYSEPVDGRYQPVRLFRRGQRLTLEALPRLALSVDAILGG